MLQFVANIKSLLEYQWKVFKILVIPITALGQGGDERNRKHMKTLKRGAYKRKMYNVLKIKKKDANKKLTKKKNKSKEAKQYVKFVNFRLYP